MTRVTSAVAAACFALALAGAPAWGHGEEVSSEPEDGATLRRAPSEVVVTLTEPPAGNARMEITDGCGDDVTDGVSISGNDIVGATGAAEPGRWRVEWAAISEVDGHATEGTFSFRVRGAKDCSDDSESPPPETTGSPSPEETAEEPPQAEGDGDGGSFPVVPVALGAVAVVGLAAAARFAGGR